MKKEIRTEVKNTLIAQHGEIYNFNINNICARYGCGCCEVQNAISYFMYSPQQKKFREAYNI